MNHIIAINVDNNTYLMCDYKGESKYTLSKEEYNNVKNKISKFNINNVTVYKNGTIIKKSLTLLGKYYHGKRKEIRYLLCDGEMKRITLTKNEIQILKNKYTNSLFSNMRVNLDGSIRMLSGSIPFLNNTDNLRNKDTVIKLGNISGVTPGSIGVSKKFLGKRVSDGKIGCVKFELFPNSYDIKNEVLAYELGILFGFDVAEATYEEFKGKKCIISIYNYDLGTEKVHSLKNEIGIEDFHNKFNKSWFVTNKTRKAYDSFIQMIILDLIMHQTDRHISNIAFKGKYLYSLYDNGRALFYDEFDVACKNIDLNNASSIINSFHTNEHGYGWVYLDDILLYENYKDLIRHDLTYKSFYNIVNKVYGNSDKKRNEWTAEYMYKVYLIITNQERKWNDR